MPRITIPREFRILNKKKIKKSQESTKYHEVIVNNQQISCTTWNSKHS